MLKCCGCKEVKPVEQFYKSCNARTGYSDYCKPCYNIKYRQAPHKELLRSYAKRYGDQHREQLNIYAKEYFKTPKGREVASNGMHKRRVRKRGNGPEENIGYNELYTRDKGICQICLKECTLLDGSIDHIKPISKGGTHTWDNVQLAHRVCNIRKGCKIIMVAHQITS